VNSIGLQANWAEQKTRFAAACVELVLCHARVLVALGVVDQVDETVLVDLADAGRRYSPCPR